MTTLIDAPATTRKERNMLRCQSAETAATDTTATEPETAAALALPAVEQASTGVVDADTDPEQPVEAATDTTADTAAEHIAEQSEPDADTEAPVLEPRTVALPTLPFVRVRKDMGEGDSVRAEPSTASNYFFDDEDEDGIVRPARTTPMTDEEMEVFFAELDAKEVEAAAVREAEEKARKDQEEKAEKKRLSSIEKRGSRRMLGTILMWLGAAAVGYGALVSVVPGM